MAENRRRVLIALGCPEASLVTRHQVHGDQVHVIAEALAPGAPTAPRPKADGLATRIPGIALGILTADCVPVLFAAPRVVAVQGDLPFVRLDAEGSIQSRRHDFERIMYKAISDTHEPTADELRRDMRPYSAASQRYLQLPEELDSRIVSLARTMILDGHAPNPHAAANTV